MNNKRRKLPYLYVNKEVVRRNIDKMQQKALKSGTLFRPHFKTHQSLEVASIYRQAGISKITVSSIEMAIFFASAGFDDITIGIPANLNLIEEINDLADKIHLNIVLSDVTTALEKINDLSGNLKIYIEIDTGYKRSGIGIKNKNDISFLYRKIQDAGKEFAGFFSHFGNTYSAKSPQEILAIYHDSVQKLIDLKKQYNTLISIGDTPSSSLLESFEGVDEIRPGNFVYNDLMQYNLGVCDISDIAVYMVATVIAKYPERNELVLHAGAVHLSKEYIKSNGQKIYGKIAELNKNAIQGIIPGATLVSLSQEHAIVACSDDFFNTVNLYDNLAVIPVHSCLTANLMK